MRLKWWKIAGILLVGYSLIGGMLMDVPRQHILNESIRNLYFHVPMWFSMIVLFTIGFIYSLRYLRSHQLKWDRYASSFTHVGILFSILGLATGMEWAQYTWGTAWSNDPKQLTTALCMLSYFAYMILRSGLKDEEKRARISAAYNIFAFALMIPLLFILPRMTDSLHPGNGGNPGFNAYDLDSSMRIVFYPAVLGWIFIGSWIAQLWSRYRILAALKEWS